MNIMYDRYYFSTRTLIYKYNIIFSKFRIAKKEKNLTDEFQTKSIGCSVVVKKITSP